MHGVERRWWTLAEMVAFACGAVGSNDSLWWCAVQKEVWGREKSDARKKKGRNVHEEDVPKRRRFDFVYHASKCYLHPDLCCLYLPGSLELLMCPHVYLHTPSLHRRTPKHPDLRFYPPHFRIDYLVPQLQLTPSHFLNAPPKPKITTLTLSFL